MLQTQNKKQPSTFCSFMPIVIMMLLLAVGYGYFKFKVEPLLVLSAFVAGIIAIKLGYTWSEIETAMIDKITKTMPATLILLSVGFVIGSWVYSGTVPMLIYYGVQIINPHYFLVCAFVISAIVSTVTGTSWGSAGTVGIALMGVAGGLGIPLGAAAGAVVSGAFFGDKLSPLSDTTNIAPLAAGSKLYEHINHMLYTTIPASLLALAVYFMVGLNSNFDTATSQKTTELLAELDAMFKWNLLLLIPPVLIILSSLKKWPAIPTMLISSFIALLLGIFIQGFSPLDGTKALVGGFDVSMSGAGIEYSKDVMKLLNRGGISSVTSTMVLVFAAMCFAGIISFTGMLDKVLETILKSVKSVFSLIFSTIISCVGVALLTGSSYLSILIPGEMFSKTYLKKNLHPKNLSRTLEDAGTVVVPLVPWSAAGAYMASTLGVDTLEYLPWAILNYSGIVVALILALTGFGIAKISDKEKEEYLKKG